jgi:hypothetical protein
MLPRVRWPDLPPSPGSLSATASEVCALLPCPSSAVPPIHLLRPRRQALAATWMACCPGWTSMATSSPRWRSRRRCHRCARRAGGLPTLQAPQVQPAFAAQCLSAASTCLAKVCQPGMHAPGEPRWHLPTAGAQPPLALAGRGWGRCAQVARIATRERLNRAAREQLFGKPAFRLLIGAMPLLLLLLLPLALPAAGSLPAGATPCGTGPAVAPPPPAKLQRCPSSSQCVTCPADMAASSAEHLSPAAQALVVQSLGRLGYRDQMVGPHRPAPQPPAPQNTRARARAPLAARLQPGCCRCMSVHTRPGAARRACQLLRADAKLARARARDHPAPSAPCALCRSSTRWRGP